MLILHSRSYDVEPKLQGHDPVSTMQKTVWTNFSSFLVWSGLEKGFTYGCGHLEAVSNHFPVY